MAAQEQPDDEARQHPGTGQGGTCPPGESCYDGHYPPDIIPILDAGYCWPNGFEPENDDPDSMVTVTFLSDDPPSSTLRCEFVEGSSCEITCDAFPIGEGITHEWTAYSGGGLNPTIETSGNHAEISVPGDKPVYIEVQVVSPFEVTHASYAMENGSAECSAPGGTLSPQFGQR